MTTKSGFILNEALSMSPAESVDAQWIQLAQKRLEELENGTVQPVSLEEIKRKVRVL